MVINAPGINGEKQHDKHRNDPLFKTPKSRRLFRPEEEPDTCGQHGIDKRMHPKRRLKMTREQKQYRAAHSAARAGNAGGKPDRTADACEGDEGDVNAEEQAEEKEIAVAFRQKSKLRAAAAGITVHGVW